jgi:hypothetical protein
MVERLAELLRRENLGLDGAAGFLLDRRTPVFQCLLQRVRSRYPVRQFQLEGLFLRQRWRHAGGHKQRQKRSSHEHSLPWMMAGFSRSLVS